MRSLRLINKWIIAAILAGSAMAVNAVPITGALIMKTGFTAVNSNWNSVTNLGSATGLDFKPTGPGGAMAILMGTGAYSTLGPFPVRGSIKDIQFSPLGSRNGSGGILAGPVTDFWTVGAFSFALNSINVLTLNNTSIVLSGTGVVTGGAGTTATSGNWVLAGNKKGGAGIFSWSTGAGASGTAVPEPGALALLGIGLVAIGAVRVRQSVRG
jgi:hypothetical protein